MTTKDQKSLIILTTIYVLSIALYFWFIGTDSFLALKSWSEQNIVLTIIFLVTLKIIGIVWPPLPGGLITLGSIPVLGWQLAYASDFTGSAIGSSIDYYIGKKYGHKIVHKLFDKKTIERIHSIKIKKNKEIEATFALRLVGGNTISEAISYAAGLLGIRYKNFLIGTVLSHLFLGIPTYFLVANIFNAQNLGISLTVSIIAIAFLWKAKGRYFE
jgi:uncharacterized membrane protein YdjX (TVP38/TMEM64 family)